MAKTALPPGFRFHPSDIELVKYHLKRKVMGKPVRVEVISEIDIYKFSPWDLPDKSCLRSRDLEWYFFCPRQKKYGSGGRTNRATESGYWKSTGKDRPVQSAGMIKTLVFHLGKAPKGERTNWVMHEYRLEDKDLASTGVIQDAYVLCKIFQKSGLGPQNGAQYGAPFNEEEWDDDVDVDYVVPFLSAGPSTAATATALPNNPNNLLVTCTNVPVSTSAGSSSEAGPSVTVHSPDKMLPTILEASMLEVHQPPSNDDLLSLLDIFTEDDAMLSNNNDKNEKLDNISMVEIAKAGYPLDGNNIYNDLGDLGELAKLSGNGLNLSNSHEAEFIGGNGKFLELVDLESPLNGFPEVNGAELIPTEGLSVNYNCFDNTEFEFPVNPFGNVQHVPLLNQSQLPHEYNGFDNNQLVDVFPKARGVEEYASHGSNIGERDDTFCKQLELGSRHVPPVYSDVISGNASFILHEQSEAGTRFDPEVQTR